MFGSKKIRELKADNKLLTMLLERKEIALEKKDEELRLAKHNEMILLEHSNELIARNKDLENNIEFLFNNLSPKKRKLIRPEAN